MNSELVRLLTDRAGDLTIPDIAIILALTATLAFTIFRGFRWLFGEAMSAKDEVIDAKDHLIATQTEHMRELDALGARYRKERDDLRLENEELARANHELAEAVRQLALERSELTEARFRAALVYRNARALNVLGHLMRGYVLLERMSASALYCLVIVGWLGDTRTMSLLDQADPLFDEIWDETQKLADAYPFPPDLEAPDLDISVIDQVDPDRLFKALYELHDQIERALDDAVAENEARAAAEASPGAPEQRPRVEGTP